MKPEIAIVESDVERVALELAEAYRALRAIEADEQRIIRTASEHRLHVGRLLVAARSRWPERGPRAKGWGELLKRIGMEQPTAWRYMELAGYVAKSCSPNEIPDRIPTYVEAGLDQPRGPQLSLVPDPPAGDRDSYCTPEFITACFPVVDFDPCSNSRSTVRCRRAWWAERGEDGLSMDWNGSGYWNVPYSKPLPWAEKFDRERPAITAAGWLVNTDQSTRWWSLLVRHLPLRLDFDDRIQFVAPPGVPASQNDRPQTLLMDEAFWRGCDQPALLKLGTLWRRSGLALT